jgi:muramoyltetrapeptide carboxypeptidase
MNQNRFLYQSIILFIACFLLILFFSIVKQSKKTHDYTTQFTKGDTIAILQPKNVEDNLKPAIDLLHSWGFSNRKYN